MGYTKIEWTDRTWSPLRARIKSDAARIAANKGYTSLVRILAREKQDGSPSIVPGRTVGPHCERISRGCDNCYSETNNSRCLPSNGTGLPFDRRSRDLIDAFVDEKILVQPLKWKEAAKVFVENQSDLFGEWVRAEHIDRVFAVMSVCEKHTFQVLTKRPERMLEYICTGPGGMQRAMAALGHEVTARHLAEKWPLPNLWLGVSAEDQAAADRRIPLLLRTPAAVRFVSYEPALGPVDFRRWLTPGAVRTGRNSPDEVRTDKLDWIIVGGESGPRSRPFDIAWARQTIDHCQAADVACFVKQLGAKPQQSESAERAPVRLRLADRKGGDLTAWPESLRVRQFPGGRTMTA